MYTRLRKKVKDDKWSGAGQVKLREGQQLRLDVLGFLGEHSTHCANMEMGRVSIDTELFAFYFCIFNTVVLLMLNVMFVFTCSMTLTYHCYYSHRAADLTRTAMPVTMCREQMT